MDLLILISFILSVVLGLTRSADLVWGTDPATGLCTVGSVWWRYLALGIVVAVAVAAGRFRGGKAGSLCTRKPAAGVAALVGAACFLAAAAARFASGGAAGAGCVRVVLGAVCAGWLSALANRWLTCQDEWKAPTGGVLFAVAGSLLFYWNVLMCFMENSSSWHRVAQTAVVWQMLAALLLLSALARALYLPQPENGGALCAAALAAFALCLCWEAPHTVQLVQELRAGGDALAELCGSLALCSVGALGGICAAGCAGKGQ